MGGPMAAPVPRLARAAFFFATYGVLAALSLWFAYELRFSAYGETSPAEQESFRAFLFDQRPLALLWIVPLKVVLLGLAGQFRGVFYYFRLPDALRLGLALLAATVLVLTVMGMSFNIMTLGGIAAAVGLLIDDVIVMVEHIARRARARDMVLSAGVGAAAGIDAQLAHQRVGDRGQAVGFGRKGDGLRAQRHLQHRLRREGARRILRREPELDRRTVGGGGPRGRREGALVVRPRVRVVAERPAGDPQVHPREHLVGVRAAVVVLSGLVACSAAVRGDDKAPYTGAA